MNQITKIDTSTVEGFIYKAENTVNGKIYVGVTNNLKRRKYLHKSQTKKGSSTYFHRALRKYGNDNFSWEIVDSSSDYKIAATELEPHYIKKFKSNNPKFGYNLSSGGDSFHGSLFSDEWKRRISEACKGRTPWNKGKKGMQVAWNKGKNTPGKKHTKDDLVKMRINKNNKPVGKYNLEGDLLETFQSQRDAARILGIKREGIRDCCNDIQKTAYGFIWKNIKEGT